MFCNLEAERARKRMTQRDMCDLLGITRSSYWRKTRSGMFTLDEVRKLCEYFDKPFEYLFAEGEEEKNGV